MTALLGAHKCGKRLSFYENGAKEVHMRSACPPIMYGCKYLNFSRSTSEMELIARQIVDENEGVAGLQHIDEYSNSNTERGKLLRDEICRRLQLTSLEFQSLEGTIRAVGKPTVSSVRIAGTEGNDCIEDRTA